MTTDHTLPNTKSVRDIFIQKQLYVHLIHYNFCVDFSDNMRGTRGEQFHEHHHTIHLSTRQEPNRVETGCRCSTRRSQPRMVNILRSGNYALSDVIYGTGL